VRKSAEQCPQPIRLEDVPDPDGMNRWIGVLASLVARPSQTRGGDPGTRYYRPVERGDASSRRADPGSRRGSSRPDISQDRPCPAGSRHAHRAARGSRDGRPLARLAAGGWGCRTLMLGRPARSVIHVAIWALAVMATDCNGHYVIS